MPYLRRNRDAQRLLARDQSERVSVRAENLRGHGFCLAIEEGVGTVLFFLLLAACSVTPMSGQIKLGREIPEP